MRETGAEVLAVVGIFTYGFPQAYEAFQALNCPLYTLTDYHTLIQVAQENGSLTAEELQKLEAWKPFS